MFLRKFKLFKNIIVYVAVIVKVVVKRERASGSASSKGCTIRQVEILSNKLLTTAFEASLGCITVM